MGRGGGERTETDLKNLSDRPFVLSVEQLPSLRGVTKVSCGYRHSLAVVEPLRSTELWKAVEERERERRKRRLGRGTESLFGGFEREGEEDREEDEEEMREDRERKGKRDGRKGVLSSFSLLPPSMKHSGMAVPSLKRICERAIASNPSILDLGSALEVLDAALQLRSRFLCSEALELIVRNLVSYCFISLGVGLSAVVHLFWPLTLAKVLRNTSVLPSLYHLPLYPLFSSLSCLLLLSFLFFFFFVLSFFFPFFSLFICFVCLLLFFCTLFVCVTLTAIPIGRTSFSTGSLERRTTPRSTSGQSCRRSSPPASTFTENGFDW